MQALAEAYNNNPTLNQARAQLRVTDEGVPIAKSTGRPTATASLEHGHVSSWSTSPGNGLPHYSSHYNPSTVALQIVQPIFQGFRTRNSVKQAESAVLAQRESLKNTEQQVLLDAVTAYMDVIRDGAIVQLRQRDLEFLDEQVGASRDRFEVGEGTRTDVSQAQGPRGQRPLGAEPCARQPDHQPGGVPADHRPSSRNASSAAPRSTAGCRNRSTARCRSAAPSIRRSAPAR